MAESRNIIRVKDESQRGINSAIKNIQRSLHIINQVNKSSQNLAKTTNNAINNANSLINKLNSNINKIKKNMGDTKKEVKNVGANLGGWIYTIKNFMGGLDSVMTKLENLSNVKIRLSYVADNMGSDLGTVSDYTKLYARQGRMAQETFNKYFQQIGSSASGSFANVEQLTLFTDTVNKMFSLSGTGMAQQESAMLQLTQALGSGVLRGEEFNAVLEASPMIIDAIAKQMGVTRGAMKQMASDGEITSNVIIQAMLNMNDEVTKSFNAMPYTFSQVKQLIMQEVNTMIDPMAQKMTQFWTYVGENFERLTPIILGVGGAIGGVTLALGLLIAKTIILNTVLKASPYGWILMVIGLVVGALVGLGKWLHNLWKTNLDFKYGVLEVWDDIMFFFKGIPLFFQMVGNGIANAFSNTKIEMATILQDMVNNAIDSINELITTVNKVLKTSFDTLDRVEFATKVQVEEQAKIDNRNSAYANAKRDLDKARTDQKHLRAIQHAEEILKLNQQANAQKQIEDKASAPVPIVNVDTVNKIKGEVNLSDSDINMLEDMAKIKYVSKNTTLTPTFKVEIGTINENVEKDGLLDEMSKMIIESLATNLD